MATQGDSDMAGGWQEVRRKRPYPANWRLSSPPIPESKPYIPYSKPTYAQVLCNSPRTALLTQPTPTTAALTAQPTSPASPFAYYVSPHSPSRLRFPPSHTFPEWKGRCFRCCRTGHSAAKCRNPKRCGRCWSYGHIGSACKQDIVAPPPPIKTSPQPAPRASEPGFEELFSGSYPYRAPEMPSERPQSLHCFLERDSEYFAELDRLRQAVVMHTGGYQWDLSIDNAVTIACRTKLVHKDEILVSQMSGSRFLILLPHGLDPDTFINKTPQELWDEGVTFQPWSPLDDASISIPAYKVLLRLVGLPPHLCRERYIRQTVARFGVFLGSMEPENTSSIASWMVAVGVDDLTLVPPQLVTHIGGMMYYVQVYTEAWHRGPIYTADDMPKHPKIYRRPVPPPSSTSSSENGTTLDDQELIPMSTHVLRDMCRGRTADSLPPELRRFATMDVIESQDPGMPTQVAATRDPNPEKRQSFNIPQNPQSASTRMPVNSGRPLHSKDVTGQPTGHLLIQSSADQRTANHKKSPTPTPAITFQKEPVTKGLVVQNQLLSHDVTGHFAEVNNSLQAGKRRIEPQRILLRGDSSKTAIYPPISVQIPSRKPSNLENNSKTNDLEAHSTELIDTPMILEPADTRGKLGQVPDAKKNSNKTKGFPCGPTRGPLATKYKWTKPTAKTTSSSSLLNRKTLEAGRPKKIITRPPLAKRATGKEKITEQTSVSFNPAGFYEVEVQYDHIAKLASACGFKNSDIEGVIAKDNEERKIQARGLVLAPEQPSEEVDLDLGRFDPDPADELDELTSEEEA